MAKVKIISIGSNTDSRDIYGAPVDPTVAGALLVEGKFVGLNALGQIVLADFRNSVGRPIARGALWQANQMTDFRGNVIDTMAQMSYVRQGKIGNLSGLVPGQNYYLSSGGGYQLALPGTTGDSRQVVGYAETPQILVIALGAPVIA
jgi:hypothetical protein